MAEPIPANPTLIQEKEELHRLNERLSIFIETVENLETENSSLNRMILHTAQQIKSDYESELNKIRKILDDTSNEKATALLSCEKYRVQVEDLSIRLNKKSHESLNLVKELQRRDEVTKDLKHRLVCESVENRKLENQLRDVVAEKDTLTQEITTLKKDLDRETLQNVDLENRLLTTKEELSFKETVHSTIISEIILVKDAEISELKTKMLKNFDQKLESKTKDMKAEYSREVEMKKKEIETFYEGKISELQTKLDRQDDVASRYREKIKNLKAKIDSLSSKNSNLETNNIFLVNQIKDLDKTLEEEISMHMQCRLAKDEEILNLKEEMTQQLSQYKTLLNLKTALDEQIDKYRKLLEYGEARLNTSDRNSSRSSSQSETPIRGVKRLRSVEKTILGTKISSRSLGDIILLEQDINGSFIKVHNTGCQEVCLGDWKIIQKGIGAEVNYQFNSSVMLKPTETITVWSYNTNVTHDPQNLVMNSQKWCSSSPFLFATLLNKNGDEVASTETVKVSENSEVRYMEE